MGLLINLVVPGVGYASTNTNSQERLNDKTIGFETHFTFTDQEKDEESGLLYYGARYYNPALGRFTQIDPVIIDTQRKEFAQALQNPQLLNAYSYTANNSLKYADESGEFAVIPFIIAGLLAVTPAIMTTLNTALPMIPAYFDNPKLTGETAARIAPLSGDAIDIAESATGINAFSGEKLSGFERALTVGASALPVVSGQMTRNAAKNILKNGQKIIDESKRMTPDQVALKNLVNEVTNQGTKPLSVKDTETVLDWGEEINHPGLRAKPGDVSSPSNWTGPSNSRPSHIHLDGTKSKGHVLVQPGVKPRTIKK